jgi:hypothetical protein
MPMVSLTSQLKIKELVKKARLLLPTIKVDSLQPKSKRWSTMPRNSRLRMKLLLTESQPRTDSRTTASKLRTLFIMINSRIPSPTVTRELSPRFLVRVFHGSMLTQKLTLTPSLENKGSSSLNTTQS